MNLYQLHTGQHPALIKHADWELHQFIEFLKHARDVVAKQTLDFAVEQVECEEQDEQAAQSFCYRVLYEELEKKDQESLQKTLFEGSEPQLYNEPASVRNRKPLKLEDRKADDWTLTFKAELSGNRLYLRPNDYQLRKQIEAIRQLKDTPFPHQRELLSLFSYQDKAFPEVEAHEQVQAWQVLTDLNRDGTEEQRAFVNQALNTPEFALLEGPPGSGKTTAIIELVVQLAMRGQRVLLCSATHVAIDNVIGRILGRYAEACKDHIVPVRIASQAGDIREAAVKPYRLQELVKTKKEELKRFLQQQSTLSPSQRYLKQNLDKDGDAHLSRLILDSANLVGGTTIGILQHPDLKQGNTHMEPFDYLIVDEASKVPFQEFLVPALHAKRWILVGDIHQLSPYVEDDYVAHALKTAIPQEEQARVLQASEIRKRLRNDHCYRPVVMFCPEDPAGYVDLMPVEEVVVSLPDNWQPSSTNLLELQAADIILCPEEPRFRKWMTEQLYVKAEFLASEDQESVSSLTQQHFHRRRKQGRKQKGDPYHRYTHTWNSENSWAETLAGKLNQYFGRRDAPELAEYTEQEIDDLIPYPEAKDKVQDLSRVVFPSILELLQRGVEKSSRQERDIQTIFANGMAKRSKQDRFTSLRFQHRMHPDIAETSRQHVYQEHDNLQPANSVAEDRSDRAWGYRPGDDRVLWVAHNDDSWRKQKGIVHPREVADIQRELERFLEWADRNPVPEGWQRESSTYEVAVLTFYRDQERELRQMLRKLTGQHRRYRNFDLGKRIQLTLCTVDQFQGQEADLVLLTFTKYTKGAHYHSPNRLNVALTRARHQLILFGNQKWMAKEAGLEALKFLGKAFKTLKTY